MEGDENDSDVIIGEHLLQYLTATVGGAAFTCIALVFLLRMWHRICQSVNTSLNAVRLFR